MSASLKRGVSLVLATLLIHSLSYAENELPTSDKPDDVLVGGAMMGATSTFRQVDADQDGKISPQEWNSYRTNQANNQDQPPSFSQLDKNKDGYLSTTEMDAYDRKAFRETK